MTTHNVFNDKLIQEIGAFDKILSIWVPSLFWVIFTYPFLIELGTLFY